MHVHKSRPIDKCICILTYARVSIKIVGMSNKTQNMTIRLRPGDKPALQALAKNAGCIAKTGPSKGKGSISEWLVLFVDGRRVDISPEDDRLLQMAKQLAAGD